VDAIVTLEISLGSLWSHDRIIWPCSRPTQYHRCQMNKGEDEGKDWWHPSFEMPQGSVMKLGLKPSERCDSVYSSKLPKGLGAAILRNPDAVFGLVKRYKESKRKSVTAIVQRQSEITSVADKKPMKSGSFWHHHRSAAVGDRGKEGKRRATVSIGGMGEIRTNEVPDEDRPSEWGSPRGSIEAMAKSGTLTLRDKVTPPFPIEKKDVPHWPFVGGMPATDNPAGRYSLMQIYFSDVYSEKRAKKNKYSLRLFLHDCYRKVALRSSTLLSLRKFPRL
jgi:hypothetical protein